MTERRIFAEITVDDDLAIEEGCGTLDYLEREFGWLEQSHIVLDREMIADSDDESIWARYINYLIEWAFDHSGGEFKDSSPACYDEWLDNENEEDN